MLQYAKSIILYSSLLVPYLPDLQLLSGLFARLYLQPSRLQKCRVMPVSSGHGGFKACCGWNMVCTRFPGPSSLLHRGLTVPVLMGGQSLYISACVHKNVRVHTYTVISRCRQTIGALGKTVSVLCIFILSSSAVKSTGVWSTMSPKKEMYEESVKLELSRPEVQTSPCPHPVNTLSTGNTPGRLQLMRGGLPDVLCVRVLQEFSVHMIGM